MLPKNIASVILVFVLHLLVVNCYSGSTTLSKRNGKSRQKRILDLITDPQLNFYFEYNSELALSIVLSLPLELPSSRSVFLSFNFETNFYFAYYSNTDGIVPLPFTYITEPGSNAGTKHRISLSPGFREFGDSAQQLNDESTNKTEKLSNEKLTNITGDGVTSTSTSSDSMEEKKLVAKKKQTKDEKGKKGSRRIRSLFQNYFMSRRRFFKMMESKMDSTGLKGTDCLLKAICETAADTFGHHNGVVGSIFDILFLPSASVDEKLPKKYYKAEANGKIRNCNVYNKMCPSSLFDYISKVL